VIIYFKEKYSWGYSVDYQGNSLVISLKNTPGVLYSRARSREPFDGLYIGVDAGHGGRSSGAVSPSGINEKDLNLDMALVLKNELEKRGARVVLSRSEDVDVSMKERADLFKKEKVDLMVSVHCNAGGNPLGEMGTSTYYRHIEYRELAETILHRLLEKDVRNFGLIGNFNFSLNAPTEFPSVLVETLFMSSLPEEELLADPGFRRDMMLKVVEGLEDYMDKVRKDLK
jgi:N-acetylmuramoyl-L-alanine amidase